MACLASGAAWADQAKSWQAVEKDADSEGKVVLYSNIIPPLLLRLRAEFEKRYPHIQLQYYHFAAAQDSLNRVDQEHAAKMDNADVVPSTEGATYRWFEQAAKDHALIAPIGPNAQSWPTKYFPRDRMTPLMVLEPIVITYNTTLVKIPITGYHDLLRPELKDHLGTSDLLSPTLESWYVWLDKTQGPHFVEQLAAQHPRVYNSGLPSTQATASGEVYASAFANATNVSPLIDAGAPLKIVVPKPAFGVAYPVAILGSSKRPDAAQVLVDFLLSPEWQEIWAGRGETASPRPGIPGSLNPESVDIAASRADTPEAVQQYKAHWETLYKKN